MKKFTAIALIFALLLLASCAKDEEPEAAPPTVSGSVTALTPNNLELTTAASVCDVAVDAATVIENAAAVYVNDVVTVEYSGELTGGAYAVKIKVDSPSGEGTSTAEGEIQSVTETALVLNTRDGLSYVFDAGEAAISASAGDIAAVTYTGGITDFPEITSIRVIKERVTERHSGELLGTVSNITESALTLNLGSAHSVTLSLTEATASSGSGGVKRGDLASVLFSGDLLARPAALYIWITDTYDEIEDAQNAELYGRVAALAADGIFLETLSGHGYLIETGEDTATEGSAVVGSEVKVFYSGNLAGGEASASEVSVIKDAPSADERGEYVGSIAEMGDGSLKLALDSGESMEFSTGGAAFSGDAKTGSGVRISYSYDGESYSANNVTVISAPPKSKPHVVTGRTID